MEQNQSVKQLARYLCILTFILVNVACSDSVESPDHLYGLAVLKDTAVLASDEFAGRDPQTDEYDLSISFVSERFAALGLEPISPSGDFCQTVPLRRIKLDADKSYLLIGDRRFAANDSNIVVTSPSATSTEILTGELFFAGYGIDAPEYGLDPYDQYDVRGKVVVYLNGSPKGLPSLPAAHLSAKKTEVALARGAIATIEIETPQSLARRPWSLIRGHFSKPFGVWTDSSEQVPEHLLGGRATVRTNAEVTEALFSKKPEIYAGIQSSLIGIGVQGDSSPLGITVSINRSGVATEFESCNVIGVLPGRDPDLSDEAIVYMAHLDHMGIDPSLTGDQVYNGAVDNAIGVGILLKVAELLSTQEQEPARTVVFAALTAEEDGLLGSDYLAHNPISRHSADSPVVVAAVNVDMPILTFPLEDIVFLGDEESSLGWIANAVADRHKMAVSRDPSPAEASFVRSDHYSFVKIGIPALQTRAGPSAGGAKAEATYRASHYHQTSDQMDLGLDVESVGRFTAIQADLVRDIANMTRSPEWLPESVFFNKVADSELRSFTGPFPGKGKLTRPTGFDQIGSATELLVPARDGVLLATDVYLPAKTMPTETILIRTPYNKAAFEPAVSQTGTVATFVEHGYAVLVQDSRGKFGSGGQFSPLNNDDFDAYDTMDWIISQDWSNGVVGTFGCSYLGETQMASLHLQHPAWRAAIPMASAGANNGIGGRYRPFAVWNGGAFELAMGLSWFYKHGRTNGPDSDSVANPEDPADLSYLLSTLPVENMLAEMDADESDYRKFVVNPPGAEYWDAFPYMKGRESADIPMLFVSSWYDYGTRDTFAQFDYFRKKSPTHGANHRVVIDPGLHCGQHQLTDDTSVGARSVGDARFDFFGLYLDWFDYWLRDVDNGINDLPLVSYYRIGDNQWLSSGQWPPAGTEYKHYYFANPEDSATFRRGTLSGSAAIEPSSLSYVYDPSKPLPTLGAPVCCTNPDGEPSVEGSYDQSANADRSDVLIFETAPLVNAVDVTGPVSVTLYVSSDAKDTDFTAKLIDVYPDGRAFNVVDGIQRMRWRHGYDAPEFMEEGKIYEVNLDLQAASNMFLPGHRIQVEISSSNFPRFTRNLNTGEMNHVGSDYVPATNTIYLGGDRASHILLPVKERRQEL